MPNETTQPTVKIESLGYSKAQVEALLKMAAVPHQLFQGAIGSLPVAPQNQPSHKQEKLQESKA